MNTLLHYELCPFSRSIRLALAEQGLQVELAEEYPWEWHPEFLAINPAGDLPVLMLGDGRNFCGAYAISEYLGEGITADQFESPPQVLRNEEDSGLQPQAPTLEPFPGNPEDRAEVRRIVDWFHGKCHRETTSFLLEEKVYTRFKSGEIPAPDGNVMRAARENLAYHLSYLNSLSSQRNWLAGDELSFADLAAAAQLSCLDYLDEIRWDPYPEAKTWYARIKSRKSFRPLLEDRIPGMAPPHHYADLDF